MSERRTPSVSFYSPTPAYTHVRTAIVEHLRLFSAPAPAYTRAYVCETVFVEYYPPCFPRIRLRIGVWLGDGVRRTPPVSVYSPAPAYTHVDTVGRVFVEHHPSLESSLRLHLRIRVHMSERRCSTNTIRLPFGPCTCVTRMRTSASGHGVHRTPSALLSAPAPAYTYGNRDGRAAKHTLKLLTNSPGI